MSEERTVLVDASVCITLAAVGAFDLLASLADRVVVPDSVEAEVTDDPATERLEAALGEWLRTDEPSADARRRAATQLGVNENESDASGDVALLACAMEHEQVVVVTDDRPLRQTCTVLSIPVSGSIGVLVRGVEQGEITAEDAIETLYAMDEVGARLSASLVRRAERLIEEAAENG